MTQEELQEQLLKLQEQLKQFEEDNKLLKTTLEEKTKREQELLEYNQKLFMRVTEKQDKQEEKEEKEEIPIIIDKEIYSMLNEKEKQELKEIIEEEE